MELKIKRIRTTIDDLRKFWIFDNDFDKVKIPKFKQVVKIMERFY